MKTEFLPNSPESKPSLLARTALTLFAGLLGVAVAAPTWAGDSCSIIPVEPVEPVGSSTPAKCDPRDKQDCQIKKALAKFGKTGTGRLKIRLADPSPMSPILYLGPIIDSPVTREVLALRKKARALSHWKDVCEAIPVYIGDTPIAGVGPALMDSLEFDLDGQIRDGLLLLDDGKIPYVPFIASISKLSLIRAGYYEYVVAHELAHGLMQDIYGVPRMKKMTSHIRSRAGHFASAVTDPTLAWVEGFAEGFEAYLSEKYPREDLERTPHLKHVMDDFVDRADTYQEKGALRYYLSVPAFIPKVIFTLFEIDDVMSDFIKAERGQAIRDGFFIQKGTLNNLTEKYPDMMVDITELDGMLNRTPESLNQLFSKEGVVAHAVYAILKAGMADKLLESMKTDYPQNSFEFFKMVTTRFSAEEIAQFQYALVAILNPEGRNLLMKSLGSLPYAESNSQESQDLAKFLRARLSKMEIPEFNKPPIDYWVEFESVGKVRKIVMGSLDRVNVLTEPEGRLREFIRWALKDGESTDEEQEALVALLALVRDQAVETGNPLKLLPLWNAAAEGVKNPRLKFLARVIYRRLEIARGVYLSTPLGQAK